MKSLVSQKKLQDEIRRLDLERTRREYSERIESHIPTSYEQKRWKAMAEQRAGLKKARVKRKKIDWMKRRNGPCVTVKVSEDERKQRFADNMRKRMTPAEKFLWFELQHLGFEAQQIVCGYIPDFVHFKRRLCVEVDGNIHDKRKRYDRERDLNLNRHGYQVVRFRNEQVIGNRAEVVKTLRDYVCGTLSETTR